MVDLFMVTKETPSQQGNRKKKVSLTEHLNIIASQKKISTMKTHLLKN